ncbi:MAG: hypothetical protein KDD76_00980 [Rickettsiales bacterium]|nr:hypothetical protein [Rickettsiales bacterium]
MNTHQKPHTYEQSLQRVLTRILTRPELWEKRDNQYVMAISLGRLKNLGLDSRITTISHEDMLAQLEKTIIKLSGLDKGHRQEMAEDLGEGISHNVYLDDDTYRFYIDHRWFNIIQNSKCTDMRIVAASNPNGVPSR